MTDRRFNLWVTLALAGVAVAAASAVWLIIAGLHDELPVLAVVTGVLGAAASGVGAAGARREENRTRAHLRAQMKRWRRGS